MHQKWFYLFLLLNNQKEWHNHAIIGKNLRTWGVEWKNGKNLQSWEGRTNLIIKGNLIKLREISKISQGK